MLVVHVQVKVKPEVIEAFQIATLENVTQSRLEPGIAAFELLQRQDDPTQFTLVEAYRSPNAASAHKETLHYQKWRDLVAPMMAEPRQSTRFHPIEPPPKASVHV